MISVGVESIISDDTMVGVAQLVELRIVAPVVVGSIPIAHPKNLFYPPVAGR